MVGQDAGLPPIWVILGPPGSGKGTYASLLASRFGVLHLSTGDLARGAAKEPGHEELRRLMDAGELLPDSMIVVLLRERLNSLAGTSTAAGVTAVLLDGFPRSLPQAQLLHEDLQPVSLAIRIHLSDKHILAKIAGRHVCEKCGRGYNTVDVKDPEEGVYMPPMLPKASPSPSSSSALICDCGGALVRRGDDGQEVAELRLKKHHSSEGPVAEFFRRRGVLLEHNVRRGVEDLDDLAVRIRAFLKERSSAEQHGASSL
mmetsp:Transcript_136883/g.437932  ORF Transcript_136883/g.437932 Transcript_136883/m.437932 type:complete len:258 (-) Transcript_136883:89-862(-)